MKIKTAQLTLPIGVDEKNSFENFVQGPNTRLVEHLEDQIKRHISAPNQVYTAIILWGETNVGKTHLLSALAQRAKTLGGEVCFLDKSLLHPGQSSDHIAEQVLLLDDIEEFTRDRECEQTLLSLFEQIKQTQGLLLISAKQAGHHLTLELADLASRIKAMDSFELLELDDPTKGEVIRQRAQQRGIVLSDSVINWLFNHTSRDLGMLLELLERMDVTSMAQQRKVTIPLIKSMLAEQ